MGKIVSFQQKRLSTRHLILLVPVTHFKLPFHQSAQVQLMLHSLPCFPGTSDASPPSSCVGTSCPTTLSVLQGNTPLPPPTSPYAPRPTTDSLLHTDNLPKLCFLQDLISKCYGCGNKFTDEMKIPPRDLICKFKKKRERLICGQWVPGWKMAWCYFHLNINCLQLGRSTIEACDVYILSVIMAQLTDIYTKYLIKSGWWHCMKKNY